MPRLGDVVRGQSLSDENHCPIGSLGCERSYSAPQISPHPLPAQESPTVLAQLTGVGRDAKCLGSPTSAASTPALPRQERSSGPFTAEGCILLSSPLPTNATLYKFPSLSEAHFSHLQNRNNPLYLVGTMIWLKWDVHRAPVCLDSTMVL